jgi:ornithine cyclodeaminase/alanine dehydrogenase-like protein (mu-crystallin family)
VTLLIGWPGAGCSEYPDGPDTDALAQCDRIAADDHAQFQYYRRIGYVQQPPDPYADLGELVGGQKAGREGEAERTMAMNLGLALDDMAAAPEVYRRTHARGLGTWLRL